MELNVKSLLELAAYHKDEIERALDKKNPSFLEFDPVLGYVMKDHSFPDGMRKTRSSYIFEKHGGHRKMINYADQPCRINTYGDSFTLCAQVSNGETWQEVLAAHIREPIRNFGVGGYGVYQAYRCAMRAEAIPDIAAEYIILNIWDDDYMRNIDAARWNRVAWMCRDLPRAGKGMTFGGEAYPVHGFPWAHVRYDLNKGKFVELPGLCEKAEDLRKFADKDFYYNTFKDDHVVHLYVIREGGDAPVGELEKLAEAFGVKADLRNPQKRAAEALRLHHTYGIKSTEFIVDKMRTWANETNRKLMILLSYDVPTVMKFLEKGERFDQAFVDYLDKNKFLYVDFLKKVPEEYKAFKLDPEKFIERFYIERAGAQVFGHYNPYGDFWFAYAFREDLVNWLNPKPPAYR